MVLPAGDLVGVDVVVDVELGRGAVVGLGRLGRVEGHGGHGGLRLAEAGEERRE